ncbi:hypothetical protein N7471_005319 [Penicillium samsonianum]|uniref:uncharacterized protein n=1 Tax=Penicillium samsonianum TaxID=1882272 RepID=UPI0025491CFA|nr:uncharacterized protein N7471_005319 [Penicillium samsonianum]KAJ6138833.1 hypothetical protein N7471_005319 [Penicillium samsonianum]
MSDSARIGAVADSRCGVVYRGQPTIAVISFVSGDGKLFNLTDSDTHVKPIWRVNRAEAVGAEFGTQFHSVRDTLTI